MNLKIENIGKIVDNLNNGLCIIDLDGRIAFWNKAAQEITGFKPDEVVGKTCNDGIFNFLSDDGIPLRSDDSPIKKTITDGKPRQTEVYTNHKNGYRVPLSVSVRVLTGDDGRIIGGIEEFANASREYADKLRIQELEKLALVDELTQLANRNYLEKELKKVFEVKKRLEIQFGVLLIDIDHFKQFNDLYGHDVGDEVLRHVAKTLITNSRPFDIYGRWGGEEFLCIIRDTTCWDLEHLANRLRLRVQDSSCCLEKFQLNATVSIGATMVRPDDNKKTLLKRADIMLYKSKNAGRNCVTINKDRMRELPAPQNLAKGSYLIGYQNAGRGLKL